MTDDTRVPRWKFYGWRVLKIGVIVVVLGFICLVAAITLFQRRLLYLPSRYPLKASLDYAAQSGFLPWTNVNGEIIGWKLPSILPAVGSVMIMHGNSGNALNRNYLAMPIHEGLSLDVYVLEYPGYGPRAGSPTEKSLLAAGEEAWKQLPKKLPVYLVSESLGTGVAAHLAKQYGAEVAGIAMFVPYNDLVAVAQRHFRFLPVNYLLWDRYAPALWLRDYRGPIKFIVAGQDEVISTKLSLKLYEGYQGPKDLQLVADAHHNDVAAQPYQWWRGVLEFWRKNSAIKSASPN